MTQEETELIMDIIKGGVTMGETTAEENTLVAPTRDEKGVSYVQITFRVPIDSKQYWDTISKWLWPLSGNKGFPLLMKALVKGIEEGWADKLIKPEIYKHDKDK